MPGHAKPCVAAKWRAIIGGHQATQNQTEPDRRIRAGNEPAELTRPVAGPCPYRSRRCALTSAAGRTRRRRLGRRACKRSVQLSHGGRAPRLARLGGCSAGAVRNAGGASGGVMRGAPGASPVCDGFAWPAESGSSAERGTRGGISVVDSHRSPRGALAHLPGSPRHQSYPPRAGPRALACAKFGTENSTTG